MNASDEWTGLQILNKIKTSISSDDYFTAKRSLTSKEESTSKPVCLIVDEVDGALGSSFEGANSKGISQIADYLKKCIELSSK